jgi:hypothetical protein
MNFWLNEGVAIDIGAYGEWWGKTARGAGFTPEKFFGQLPKIGAGESAKDRSNVSGVLRGRGGSIAYT